MNIFSQLAAGFGDFISQWWLIIVLIVLLVVMYVVSFRRRKAYNDQMQQMLNSLKKGDKVKTVGGFYGTIMSIKETTDGKVVLLEMGEGKHVSYMSIDANAIYGIDQKEDIVYDKDGNVIEPKDDNNDEGRKKVESSTKDAKTESKDKADKDADKKAKVEQKEAAEETEAEKAQEIIEDEAKEIEQINNPKQVKEVETEKNKPINEDESKLEDIEKLIGGK